MAHRCAAPPAASRSRRMGEVIFITKMLSSDQRHSLKLPTLEFPPNTRKLKKKNWIHLKYFKHFLVFLGHVSFFVPFYVKESKWWRITQQACSAAATPRRPAGRRSDLRAPDLINTPSCNNLTIYYTPRATNRVRYGCCCDYFIDCLTYILITWTTLSIILVCNICHSLAWHNAHGF